MKKIIFRKPKFMRDDQSMLDYMSIATIAAGEASKSQTKDEQLQFLLQSSECIKQAAKAGGFFRTKDFLEYCNTLN